MKPSRPKSHIWIAIAGSVFILAGGLFFVYLAFKHFFAQICEITGC